MKIDENDLIITNTYTALVLEVQTIMRINSYSQSKENRILTCLISYKENNKQEVSKVWDYSLLNSFGNLRDGIRLVKAEK